MGRSKLLLSWQGTGKTTSTLLDHVLAAWTASGVRRTVIVIRTDADPAVKQICESYDVDVVLADDPGDMKASCLIGLKHLAQHCSPAPPDHVFVCPADIPGISSGLIDGLISAAQGHATARVADPGDCERVNCVVDGVPGDPVIVPSFQGRRGHPVLFPWSLVSQMESLEADQGVNSLVERGAVLEVEFSLSPEKMADIDTPEEYAAAARLFAANSQALPPGASNT